MSAAPPEPQTLRVYVDTSVFAGCEDEKFRTASRRLFERFRAGDMTLVLSAVTTGELDTVPEAARAVLGTVPREHTEFLESSTEAEQLADLYIKAGAVDAAMRSAALHVAFATLAGVDTLATWNFKHLLNFYRLRRFHCVNRELGHPHLEIHEAQAVLGENIVDPNKKGFDCVAFQREQRDRISRMLDAITSEERVAWLRSLEPTAARLRRPIKEPARTPPAGPAGRDRGPTHRTSNGRTKEPRRRNHSP